MTDRINIRDNIYVDLPDKWQVEENGDSVSIYNNEGYGAITMSFYSYANYSKSPTSFYNYLNYNKSPIDFIKEMANNFIKESKMDLIGDITINTQNKEKIVLACSGVNSDGWIVRLYVLTQSFKYILVSYHCKKKTKEIKVVDKIIESVEFV